MPDIFCALETLRSTNRYRQDARPCVHQAARAVLHLSLTARAMEIHSAKEMEMLRFAADSAYLSPNPCSLLLIGIDFAPVCRCLLFPAHLFVVACPGSAVVGFVGLCLCSCLIAVKATV